jgi:hypothetical protein
MPDANLTLHGHFCNQGCQLRELAYIPANFQDSILDYCQTGGVISPVFQAF